MAFFLSESTRFAAAAMPASSGATFRFVIYLCLESNVPESLVARVSLTHKFQRW